MKSLILRKSDGRVQTVADSIETESDRYIATTNGVVEALPFASFPYPTEAATGAPNPPDDLVGGYNYDFVSGGYVDSGVPAPH